MALSRTRRAALAVAAWALVALAGAPVAHAHGGGADFATLEATEVAPGRVEVRAEVRHESDGHAAEGALLEVTATGPDGATVGPAEAERQEEPGIYLAELEVPEAGDWTVSVVSSFPPGEAEVPVAVALVGQAAPGTETETEAETAPGTEPEAETGSEPEPEPPGRVESDDTVNWVVAGIFGLLGGGLGLWVSNRRSERRRAAKAEAEAEPTG